MEKAVRLACNSNNFTCAVCGEHHRSSECSKNAFAPSHFDMKNLKHTCSQGLQFNKIMVFTASLGHP